MNNKHCSTETGTERVNTKRKVQSGIENAETAPTSKRRERNEEHIDAAGTSEYGIHNNTEETTEVEN